MTENNRLQEEELRQVTGGSGFYSEEDVTFRYNVGNTVVLSRDMQTIEGKITDRGIYKESDGTFTACYYVDISPYTGSGWLRDADNIRLRFCYRISAPYKSGL